MRAEGVQHKLHMENSSLDLFENLCMKTINSFEAVKPHHKEWWKVVSVAIRHRIQTKHVPTSVFTCVVMNMEWIRSLCMYGI
jgi:hypothetical protein